MASQELIELMAKIDLLSENEKNELEAYMEAQRRQQQPHKRHSWSELRGILPYPAVGEDAQEWVTRNRREDDEHRQQLLPPEYRS